MATQERPITSDPSQLETYPQKQYADAGEEDSRSDGEEDPVRVVPDDHTTVVARAIRTEDQSAVREAMPSISIIF